MYGPAFPIDSALLPSDLVPTPDPLAATAFAPHDKQRLRDFLKYLSSAPGGNLADGVSNLSEPGLYTLAAALALDGESETPLVDKSEFVSVVRVLLAELRRRNCRAMGADPVGPVRRGRLIQIIGTFTTLTPAGGTPLQENKLAGDCPFCGGGSSFQVYLPQVRWQCFACLRSGALLEFAEGLIELAGDRPDSATNLASPDEERNPFRV